MTGPFQLGKTTKKGSALRVRLGYRIAALTVLVLLPVVAASGFALIKRASGYLFQEAENDAVHLAATVVRATRHDMRSGDPGHLPEVLQGISLDQSVRSIQLYDGRGRLRYPKEGLAKDTLNFTEAQCTSCHGDPRQLSQTTRHCLQWEEARLVLRYPIRNEVGCSGFSCHASVKDEPLLGLVKLETDGSSVLTKVRRLRKQGAIWGAVVLFTVALPPLIVFRFLVERPLKECLRLVREVSKDNLRARSRFHPQNEWGELLHAFDLMVSDLFRTRVALEALNRDLEGQVGQRTRELEHALDVAQESDRMKTEFLANLSHEFSTPIQGVIGFAQLLLDGIDGELVPSQREDVETILRNGRRLLDWVEDLLELARLDGQRRFLCVDRLKIEDLAEEAVEAGRIRALGKPLQVVYKMEPGCPLVFGEVAALRRILFHLVANAVRHTPEGTVLVAVERDGDDWVAVRVEDTGPGIAQEVLEAALNGFASKSGGGGLAVGLSLARRLIELHQGTFEIRTGLGQGTQVRVKIPVAPKAEPEDSASQG